MYRKYLLTILVAVAASVALPESALSQEASRQDVTAQAFGSLVTGTTQNGIDHNESIAAACWAPTAISSAHIMAWRPTMAIAGIP